MAFDEDHRPAAARCDGDGLFPADYTCLACLMASLAEIGLSPDVCPHCSGVVDLLPRDTNKKAVPHAHP